jgi:hypothetical protein
MTPEPLYRSAGLNPAYQLRYSWTGWPSEGHLPHVEVVSGIKSLWEGDGLRLLEHTWSDREVQLAFSVRPDVAPVFVAARAKGRLQHALSRAVSQFSGFSRKVALRSIGDNSTQDVAKLRELIVQMAVQGRLTPQDTRPHPARRDGEGD